MENLEPKTNDQVTTMTQLRKKFNNLDGVLMGTLLDLKGMERLIVVVLLTELDAAIQAIEMEGKRNIRLDPHLRDLDDLYKDMTKKV